MKVNVRKFTQGNLATFWNLFLVHLFTVYILTTLGQVMIQLYFLLIDLKIFKPLFDKSIKILISIISLLKDVLNENITNIHSLHVKYLANNFI